MTESEHKSDLKFTTDTLYLILTGKLQGVYYENFEENWPRYKSTALCKVVYGCHIAVSKIRKNIYKSDKQITFEPQGHFKC